VKDAVGDLAIVYELEECDKLNTKNYEESLKETICIS
jgi:hypothetical protein